jgi:hypothetical protein
VGGVAYLSLKLDPRFKAKPQEAEEVGSSSQEGERGE